MRPNDEAGHFNLACGEAQLGQRDDALRNLCEPAKRNPLYASRALALVSEDFSTLANDAEFLSIIGVSQTLVPPPAEPPRTESM